MNLREARNLAGLSRNRLAEMAGTTTTTIYDLETGRNANPAHETVVRIIRALQRVGLSGLTMDQIFPVADPDGASTEATPR